MLNFKKFEYRLPDSPWRLPDSPVRGVDDSPTRRVGELATPRLAESGSRRLSDSPSFSIKHSKADSPPRRVGESLTPRLAESETRRLLDLVCRGVVFRLRISPRIRSQKRNGSKGSVRDLWGPNFCKNPRKSASLPCPFNTTFSKFWKILDPIYTFAN
jgi:hypothetical protein